MRLSLLALSFLAFVTLVAAWSPEDHEIFRLRDEIEASEGPDVTFYDFLGVARNANQDDLKAALKKKSRTMHPDKVKRSFVASKSTGKPAKGDKPGVHVSKGPSPAEVKAAHKAASDRWARIQLVKKVLEGAGRARYDHFLANGFPKWKGTGYYYARFRPGLGSVLLGLFVFVGGAGHYIALYMSWKRQQEFVGRYIKFARHAAWGDNLVIPGVDSATGRRSGNNTPPATDSDAEAMQPMNRRQRRMQEKDARKEKPEKKSKAPKAKQPSPADTPTSITGPKKRVVAENGKILVVDAVGNVYLEQKNDEGETQEFLLDPNELPTPSLRDTALFRLPLWAYSQTAGRLLSPAPALDAEGEEDDAEVDGIAEVLAEKATGDAAARRVKSRRNGRK